MNTPEQDDIQFLSIEDVLQIHDSTIAEEGGLPGIRDVGLLQSALMMPSQQFGGEYLHFGFAGKAAAYLYHVAANHPFLDGNKRTATLCALLFLRGNGMATPKPAELERVTWAIADGSMTKLELTAWFHVQIGEPVPPAEPSESDEQ